MTDLSDPRLIVLRDMLYDYFDNFIGQELNEQYARGAFDQINRDLMDIDEELFRLKQLEK